MAAKKDPVVNMLNKKPYRTKKQKLEARRLARKDSDGAIRSAAPVSYHAAPKDRSNAP